MSDQHVTAQVVALFTQAANGGGAQFLSQKSELWDVITDATILFSKNAN